MHNETPNNTPPTPHKKKTQNKRKVYRVCRTSKSKTRTHGFYLWNEIYKSFRNKYHTIIITAFSPFTNYICNVVCDVFKSLFLCSNLSGFATFPSGIERWQLTETRQISSGWFLKLKHGFTLRKNYVPF